MQPDTTTRLSDFRITPRLFYLSAMSIVVGAAGAFIALALTRMIGFFTNLFFYHRISFAFVTPYPNHLGYSEILVPVIGALIIGLMARYGSDKIRGHGIPEAMEAILIGKSVVSPKVALLKPISAAISIGSGGPFGAEGPIIMSGSSFGSVIGQMLHLTAAERKIMLLCGAAAGMSATFHAPIASVFFAVELLAFEFRLRSIVPIALASGIADYVRTLFMGNHPLFPSTVVPSTHADQLFICAAFGIVGSIAAYLLTRAIYGVEDLFMRLPIHWMWWPAIGGVFIGVGGFIVPQALGVGYDTIGQLVTGNFLVHAVLLFLIVKTMIWIIALGSGTSGGILAPLLIIGGTLGELSARILHIPHPGVWAILGMAALFAGVTRSPLTAVVFMLELTHDMSVLFPVLIASVLAAGISAVILPRSILTEKIARRGRHIARDCVVHPLELKTVAQLEHPPLVAFGANDNLKTALQRVRSEPERYRHQVYPVHSEDGRWVGAITHEEILKFGASLEHADQPIGGYAHPYPTIHQENTVMQVMHRMLEMNTDRFVALDSAEKPIGVITKRTILLASKSNWEEEHRRERVLVMGARNRRRPDSSSGVFVSMGE